MESQSFDREAAERILRRAVELADGIEGYHTPGISEEALREAAEELGMDGGTVVRAAAEERLGMLSEQGRRADRFVGPAEVSAVRVFEGSAGEALDRIDEWLRHVGAFRRQRRVGNMAEYTRRTDPVAGVQRSVRSVLGHEALSGVRRLRVVGQPIGDDRVIVAMIADLEMQRTAALFGGGSVATVGIGASAIEAALVTPWLWLGVPASAAVGLGIMVGRSRSLGNVAVAMEGVLESIAGVEPKQGLLGGVGVRMLRNVTRLRPPA